ncbi:MAG: methyltransferase [Desulfurococcaceae archaeon]
MGRSTPRNKSSLEQALSVFKPFERVKRYLEQYPTPSSIIAHVVWTSFMKSDVVDSSIADYGCGDGRFLVASLLMGGLRGVCVDIDEEILTYGKDNILRYFPELVARIIYIRGDATSIALNNIDLVIMNPPFGVVRRNRGLDIKFLVNAMRISNTVYSIHKYSCGFFRVLRNIVESMNFNIEWFEQLDFEIPMLYNRHRRRVYRVKTVFLIVKKRKGD